MASRLVVGGRVLPMDGSTPAPGRAGHRRGRPDRRDRRPRRDDRPRRTGRRRARRGRRHRPARPHRHPPPRPALRRPPARRAGHRRLPQPRRDRRAHPGEGGRHAGRGVDRDDARRRAALLRAALLPRPRGAVPAGPPRARQGHDGPPGAHRGMGAGHAQRVRVQHGRPAPVPAHRHPAQPGLRRGARPRRGRHPLRGPPRCREQLLLLRPVLGAGPQPPARAGHLGAARRHRRRDGRLQRQGRDHDLRGPQHEPDPHRRVPGPPRPRAAERPRAVRDGGRGLRLPAVAAADARRLPGQPRGRSGAVRVDRPATATSCGSRASRSARPGRAGRAASACTSPTSARSAGPRRG